MEPLVDDVAATSNDRSEDFIAQLHYCKIMVT